MHLTIRLIFILLYTTSAHYGYSQVSDPYNASYINVIGASPNVSALNKYIETPVNYYTGIPNINIPIYTIKEKDLILPLTLNYHSGGIRVNEEASRVGLGWVLQAGGEISRSIRGGDDFYPQYGYLNNTMPESINDFYGVRSSNNTLYPSSACQISGENFSNVDMANVINYNPNLSLDLEPDSYNFNIGDYTGKFIIKKNKTIILSKPNGLEITLTDATYNNCKWRIRKPDGTILLFEQKENSTSVIPLQHGSASIGGTTVWYLTKITTPLGFTVTFNYSTASSGFITEISQMSERQDLQSLQSNFNSIACPLDGALKVPSTPTSHDIVQLTSINFDYGQISFTYSDRLDVAGDKKLDKITITNLANSFYNKDYLFNYDYFIANHNLGRGYSQGTAGDLINKRLKLSSLTEKTSAGSLSTSTYEFQYNETYLPQKDNYARDEWGFYNGAFTNSSLLPTLTYGLKNSSNAVSFNTFSGADRKVNPNFSQAYILKQIKYPTGGTTNFEYESNDFDIGNSIFASYMGTNYQVGLTQHQDYDIYGRGNPEKTIYKDMRAEVADGNGLYIQLSSGYGSSTFVSTNSNLAYLKVYQKGSTTALYTNYLGRTDTWTNTGSGAYTYSYTFPLPPGEYNVVLYADNSLLFLQQINISTNWIEEENKIDNHSIKLGGGLRIKRITDVPDPSNTSNQIIKRFEYHSLEDRNSDGINEEYSFGRRMSPFQFFCIDFKGIGQIQFSTIYCNVCNTLSLYSNSLNQINNIGYDKVVEYFGANGENGKSLYEFSNSPDQILSYIPNGHIHDGPGMSSYTASFYNDINVSNRCAGLDNFADVQNGDLMHQTDFSIDATTSQFNILHEIINTYNLYPLSTKAVFGYKAMADNFDQSHAGPNDCFNTIYCYTHLMQYPVLQASFDRITSKIERTYSQTNLQNYIEQKTEYLYEQSTPTHYQPIQITNYPSSGIKQKTFTIYPSDYPSGTTFIDNMMNNHVVNVPVEKVFEEEDINNNSFILRGSILQYSNTGVSLPVTKFNLETSSPINLANFKFSNRPIGILPVSGTNSLFQADPNYKPQLNIDQYSSSNNLLQQHKTSDINLAYIWDYKRNYPVAEVKKAMSSQIAYTSFEADGVESNWTFNSAAINTTGGITGKNCYTLSSNNSISKNSLPNGSYVVSYWLKNNSGTVAVNNTIMTSSVIKNGWTFYAQTFNSVTNINITGTGIIDELRLYPADAQMSTFSYDPLVGMTSQCDIANHITYYEYDEIARLKLIRDIDGNIIKKFDYHYVGQTDNSPTCATCEANGGITVGKKCINGVCEQGKRVNQATVKQADGTWRCGYKYKWSDGSNSTLLYEYNTDPCLVN